MRRFAIFSTALLVLILIGFQPRAAGRTSHKESVCVCMASRASLMMKSLTTLASAKKKSSSQPHLERASLTTQ
jgi:hypothetical protein